MAMRNSINVSTRETPSFILFGRQLTLPLDLIFQKRLSMDKKDPKQYGLDLFNSMRDLDRKVKSMNLEARKKYLAYANKTRVPTTLKVGDLVMIYTPVLKKGQSKKLATTLRGPARIFAKIGKSCFHVKTLGGKILRRVHADRLRVFDPTIEAHLNKPWSAELSESEKSVSEDDDDGNNDSD